MINNKLFLLVGSILIVLVILFVLRKRIFKTENFGDYSIFYPSQENPTMKAIMANIENYDIKNGNKYYQFNGVDSYIELELDDTNIDTTSNNTIELNLSVIFNDLNKTQTILSGKKWDLTLQSVVDLDPPFNKRIMIKLNEDKSSSELFKVNDKELLNIRLRYNTNTKILEAYFGGSYKHIISISKEEFDLSKIFLGKKSINERVRDDNTSENYFNGLMGGIIINSIYLESLTEAATEAATEAVSQLQQGPEPEQEGGLIPKETTSTSTTTTTPTPLGETTTQSTTGATTPAPLGETTTQSTTGATTQSTTGATTQSTTGATTPAPLGETTTQSTTGATTQSTTGATTQSTTSGEQVIKQSMIAPTFEAITGDTTQSTTTTLALENNTEILGGINETQPEVDYINTINMQNIAQNLNNNVNLALDNTINNALQVNNVAPQVNNTTAQVNNTTSQVNNTMPQINNTMPQVNNTTSQVNNTTAQVNNTTAQVNNTISQINNTMPQVNNTTAQVNNTIPQVNNTMPQVNNTMPQVNNTMPQVNNTMPQVNNTMPQVNNTMPQVNKTINNALQANIVRRVEKLENILSSAPVAYNSLDNYNDITIDINFV